MGRCTHATREEDYWKKTALTRHPPWRNLFIAMALERPVARLDKLKEYFLGTADEATHREIEEALADARNPLTVFFQHGLRTSAGWVNNNKPHGLNYRQTQKTLLNKQANKTASKEVGL